MFYMERWDLAFLREMLEDFQWLPSQYIISPYKIQEIENWWESRLWQNKNDQATELWVLSGRIHALTGKRLPLSPAPHTPRPGLLKLAKHCMLETCVRGHWSKQ